MTPRITFTNDTMANEINLLVDETITHEKFQSAKNKLTDLELLLHGLYALKADKNPTSSDYMYHHIKKMERNLKDAIFVQMQIMGHFKP